MKIEQYIKGIGLNTIILFLCINGNSQVKQFQNFPEKSNPITVGNKISERFLFQPHSLYGKLFKSNLQPPQITYPDVCTWLGGFWFAKATNNQALLNRLEDRFQPLFTNESKLLPKPNHVDNNVFGTLPLELYMKTKDQKYLDMGMHYANTQWTLPQNANPNRKKMG